MAIATQRPKFRTDLVAQPLEVQGQRFVDVTDPDSEQTFRFYEVEYAIASAMDGQRDVAGLLHWANDELGLESSPAELTTVVNTLADLGYLEKNGVSGAASGFELGGAGPAPGADEGPMPRGGDVELGVAGGQASERAPAVPSGAAFELGSSGGKRRPAAPEESFAGLMEDELGPAGGPGDAPAAAPTENRADTVTTAGASEPEEDISLPPPPAPPAASPAPTLTRSGTNTGPLVDDEDTQLPAPEPPSYDDDDVSVDLSDHLSLDANDVKEAVRASKVMQAVPPPDLAADIDDIAGPFEPEPAPAPIELSAPKEEPPAPAPAPAPLVATPVEDPAPTPVPEKTSAGLAPVLAVLLLFALAGGGAYYYFVVMPEQSADPAPRPGTAAATATDAKSPAPAPAPPKAALAEGPAETADVGAIAAGTLEWIIGSGEEVSEGDVVARLEGARRVEAVRQRFERRLEHYEGKLARAQEDGDDRKVSAFEAKVEEKKGLVAAEDDKLAKLIMRSPTGGTVEPVVSNGASVSQGDPVVRVVGDKGLSATFDRGGQELQVGDSCAVTLADGSKVSDCEVLAVDGETVTVGLPPSAASIGDQVTLSL